MRALGLLCVVIAVAGCALSPSMMNAEQIRAMAELRDAGTICVTATSPYGKGIVSYTLVDRSIAAKITVKDDCTTTIETQAAPAPPGAPPTPPAR